MGTKDCSIPETIKHLKICELYFVFVLVVVHIASRQRYPRFDFVEFEA